ncbi:MAG: hypothetical protein ACPGOY_07145 [Rhodospirillaceae bacterium]
MGNSTNPVGHNPPEAPASAGFLGGPAVWLSFLALIGAFGLAIAGMFWPVGGPGLTTDGHIALRLSIFIGGGVYVVLMVLLFISHSSGHDQAVDQSLSAEDGLPIRDWNGNPLKTWNDGKPDPELMMDKQ